MHYLRGTMMMSAEFCSLAYLILAVGMTLGFGPNQRMELTFLLPAGRTECFYQTAIRNDSMEVEYQVLAGSGLVVGFVLTGPSGQQLVSDFRRSDGIHLVEPTDDGDYRLCFDNSFSKLSEKMVFFEVIMNSQSRLGGDEWEDMASTESLVEYQLEDIRATLDSVYGSLERSLQALTILRAFEARDRYLLEDNLWRVSFWSCLNLLVMLAVAAAQIYTLRRLFDNTKRI
ncbi:transmembrane emp24 domain-containing protein 1a [Antennarius striatus]|uniref:transmembrane emp24 domain-containing protein 1a n=1 Tax=Antennarius striatus TaxID=241820 RepID=UPI0035B279F7